MISSLVLVNILTYVNKKKDFAVYLITLHKILEYMQTAFIKAEAADFLRTNICVILKTFGHD